MQLPTAFLSRLRDVRTQTALMVVLLVGIFAVTGFLTYQAQQSRNRHQKAIANILVSHANFASANYAEVTRTRVTSMHKLLYPSVVNDTAERLATNHPTVSMSDEQKKICRCDLMPYVAQNITYDFKTRVFDTDGEAIPEAHQIALRSALDTATLIDLKSESWKYLLAVPGEDHSVYSFGVRLIDSNRVYAIGFRATSELLKRLLIPIDSFNIQLTQNNDLPISADRFAIRVQAGERVLEARGDEPIGEAAIVNVGEGFGDFKVKTWVNRSDYETLTGDPIRGPNTPLFVSLLALATILSALVLMLYKKQTDLARARADFVANVSHELRTPLAQIKMFTETLLLGRVRNDAERNQSLRIIDQETRRLTALVENVLQLGRGERGSITLAPAATQLAPTIRDVIESFAQLPRSRNVDFRQELESRLVATVDPSALRQILINLLDNAVKYGPSGQRVYVGLAMFEEHARLWVDDEGPGIPMAQRQRVFEAFYRSPEHIAARVAGSGIGLAVVRELAALLGGTVWAEQSPSGGARLIVEFPQAYLRPEEAAGGMAVA
jgi:signal transduction histidine kinase